MTADDMCQSMSVKIWLAISWENLPQPGYSVDTYQKKGVPVEDNIMADFQVRAVTKYVMGSPLKARRVVNIVRGMPALQALEILDLMPQAAAEVVSKTIKSAVANADENFGLDVNDLVISEIMANEGPRLRRVRFGAVHCTRCVWRPHSHFWFHQRILVLQSAWRGAR